MAAAVNASAPYSQSLPATRISSHHNRRTVADHASLAKRRSSDESFSTAVLLIDAHAP
jgi:hypothetical protein